MSQPSQTPIQGFRFAPTINDTLAWLTTRMGVSRTAVISHALRQLAKAEGFDQEPESAKSTRKTISRKSGK